MSARYDDEQPLRSAPRLIAPRTPGECGQVDPLPAAAGLRLQKELLRVTLASIGDGVITTDTEGRVTALNHVAERLTGWPADEARGQPLEGVFCIVNEATRRPVESPVERALREGRVVGLANRTVLLARDGTATPIDDSAAPIRDEEGRVHGVVLVFRDVTERNRAEEALRRSEQELADFFENAAVGMHWVGPDGTILRANRAEFELLGYTRAEYLGHSIAEFHADPAVIPDILRRLHAGEELRDYAARLRCKDGSVKHVLINSNVHWEDGKFIHTRCFTRDVTDRQVLDEAQARLAAIVESSQDAIVGKTLEGVVLSWNAGAERLFGYPAAEAVGRSITFIIPPERLDEERIILERLGRGERIEHYETVRVAKDGRRLNVALTISPVRDSAGRLIGASKIARDVTAAKRAERRLRIQNGVTRALADSATLLEAAPKVLRAVGDPLGWDAGAFWCVDRAANVLRSAAVWHAPAVTVPRFEAASRERAFGPGEGLPGRVWAGAGPVWAPDVARDDNFPRAAIAAAEGLHGAFGFPVALRGEVLGVIEFFSHAIQEPDDDLLQMSTALGSEVGQFVERLRAEEARAALTAQLATELADAQCLQEISAQLVREGDLGDLYEGILDAAVGIMKSDMASMQVLDETADGLRLLAYRGFDAEFAQTFALVRPDTRTACGAARRTGRRVIVPDVTACDFIAGTPALAEHISQGIRAVQSTPLLARDGRLLGMISTHWRNPHEPGERELRLLDVLARQAADLLERRRAEETLRDSERRFRLMAETVPSIIWTAGPDGAITYANERWGEFAGLGRAPAPPPWPDLVLHPEDEPRCAAAWARALREGSAYEIEARHRRRDGVYRWFIARAVPLRDAAGKVVQWFGTSTDIDDRKRAEQTSRFLADASAALAGLADYESTLQALAGLAVPHFADWCAVDVLEPDGAVRRLAVAHPDPAKAQLARELEHKYPPRPDEPRGVRQVLRTGRTDWAAAIPDELLVAAARDEEHLRLVRELGLRSYICVPLRSHGAVFGALTFVTAESGRAYDETDVRAAEDLAHRAVIAVQNARLVGALKDADRRKDEFLATLAHELRNPLAPIRNALQIMQLAGGNRDALTAAREMMGRQVQHMVRLIDDLLDLSRVSRGKIQLRKEAVELATVLQSAIETSRPLIQAAGHELTVQLPPARVWLEADATRLAQVVGNLLNNAAKYTKEGGSIRLSAAQEGETAVIRVRDNGVGIPPEMLPRIFEMFAQVDSSLARSQGGLGIGLTLVRSLVEMHGGTVEAASEGPGKGSEFVVRLPATREKLGIDAFKHREDATHPPPANARRVLVVDDNVDAAQSLGTILKLMGHDTALAHDGPTAVELAASYRPDLVLLDIGLPGLNGYEVARRLRQQPHLRDVVLVAVTGWGQEEDRRRGREAGFDFHLTKPADLDAITKLLASLRPPSM